MLCKKCGGPVEPQYEQIGKCENCFADACDNFTNIYEDKVNLDPVSEEEALALPISNLELSIRTENHLSNKGIIFIKDLVVKTEEELRNMPNFGDMGLAEIKRQLADFGLALKKERPRLSSSPS